MNDIHDIKTIKYIKWLKYISMLYYGLCFISIVLFFIYNYGYSVLHDIRLFKVANLILYLWMINPMVLIVSVLGFKVYLKERRDPEKREQIGKKWIAFILWNVGAVIVWMVSVICVVSITGGV